MFKRGRYIIAMILIIRTASILSRGPDVAEESGTNNSNNDLSQCRNAKNKLLSNLYVDYFRSSGSCVASEGEVLSTFRASRKIDNLTEEEERILVDELCKVSADNCRQSDERRSGRLFFGVGKLLLNNLQQKLQRLGGFLSGVKSPAFGSYGLYPNQFNPAQINPGQLDAVKSNSEISYLPQGPLPLYSYPIANSRPYQTLVPASPQVLSSNGQSPFGLPMLFPQLFGYQYPQAQAAPLNFNNPPAYGPPGYHPPAFDDPCAGNDCLQNAASASNKPTSRSRHVITKRAACDVDSDVIFPMMGKAALDDSTVNILQDFPNLIQPVYFRKCRNIGQESSRINKCIQEFLPMSFFISTSNSSSAGSLLPQEFVLVESGCSVLEDVIGL